MTTLDSIFDLDLGDEMIRDGYVRRQTHPDDPNLAILNYTEKAQFERVWNEVTLACRGLIFNWETGEVLARPFRKFFNWDEGMTQIPAGPLLKAPKMDGSLGILYPLPDNDDIGLGSRWGIATRGSFTSEQAKAGSAMFLPTALEAGFKPEPGFTYLFEIIYPENRIVVDYGDFRGLVLLDVIHNKTGRSATVEFDVTRWPHKVERTVIPGFTEDLTHEIGDNEEGFVLYSAIHDVRFKMKGAEYVRLHKLLTGIDTVKVWEVLASGKSVDDIVNGVKAPDEFYGWLKETAEDLYRKHFETSNLISNEFDAAYSLTLHDVGGHMTEDERTLRKEFAKFATKASYPSAMFALFDGKAITDLVWKIVKPARVAPWEEGGKS